MTHTLDRRAALRAVLVLAVVALAWLALSTLLGGPASAETESSGASAGGVNLFWQNLFNGLLFGLLLALASVGLSLIYGTTKLSTFAHGEQVSFGALLAFFLTTKETVSLPFIPAEFTIGLPLIPAAIIAVILAAGTGWLQDKYLWAPLRHRHVTVVQQMIVSIGLSLAMVNLLQLWMGQDSHRLTTSIAVKHQFGPIQTSYSMLAAMAIAVIALLAVAYFLQRTRLGRATRAVSDNPSLAAASGIKVDAIVRLVWILAAGLAALGGVLLALYQNGWGADDGGKLLMMMFAAVTLGGLGHAYGALVGSVVIGIVAEVSTQWLGSDLKYATALLILILVLLVRPQGILGKSERVG